MNKARSVIALAVVAFGGLGACAGPAVTEPDPGPESPAAVVVPLPVEQVDLDSFESLDNAAWLAIQAAPGASAGQRVVVHAYVTRNYATLGGGTLQVLVSTARPAGPDEGTYAVLRGSPDLLGGAEVGTVLRVHAEVVGAYAGFTGRGVDIPELAVHAADDVGPYDLTEDVTVGAPAHGEGRVLVPVRVRNSSDAVVTYRVELVATSADGKVEQSVAAPHLTALAPGSTTSLDVVLDPASADAEVVLADVSRFLPAPPG